MSEINPFQPNDTEAPAESNVFLDLNKPDDATGVPAAVSGASTPNAGSSFSPAGSEGSKFSGQVILAGLVFAIGVGSIYAMRYIGMQAGIKESVAMVEYTASTTTPDFINRFETVMNDLHEASMSVQFDKNIKLPKEPFTMPHASHMDTLAQPSIDSQDQNAQMQRLARQRAQQAQMEREAKEQEIESLAQGLTLQSVIGGSRPVARVSGQPVGVGMMVSDVFEVLSIKGSTIVLEAEGMQFELTLGGGFERIK